MRNHRGLPGVNLRLGGVAVPAQFAGATPGDPGGDQINAALPRGLTGRGEMDVMLTVDGKTANSVSIIIK